MGNDSAAVKGNGADSSQGAAKASSDVRNPETLRSLLRDPEFKAMLCESLPNSFEPHDGKVADGQRYSLISASMGLMYKHSKSSGSTP